MMNLLTNLRKSLYPLDRAAVILMLLLSLVIGFLVLKGDRTAAKVRDFSWQNRQVGAEDTAFILSFSRPMDHQSVEKNLHLEPDLPGKFSWAGRRMAYTLEAPAPYGKAFELKLGGARDRFSQPDDSRTQMQPFTGQFRSRDSVFIYLGVEGDEEGRLVLENLTRNEQHILTPENLVVMDFKPYPDGDRVLFSAIDRSVQTQSVLEQKLYTVNTGIQVQAPVSLAGAAQTGSSPKAPQPQSVGTTDLILDSKDYQNLKFDLSPDGQVIIVQRVNKQNPGDFGIWMLKTGEAPKPIKTEPGGDFLIAPDSRSLAMSQGQGMAILPLQTDAQTLDFLPKYGVILSFANDGSAAAMVKFNTNPNNPTRSLFLVTNQGTEKELLKTDGSILNAQFDPLKENLYCLYTKRLPGDVYLEEPYLAAIPLKTAKRVDLLRLPLQRDIQMSLAPDGLGILFDQVVSDQANGKGLLRSSEGKAIATSKLWFLPVLQDNKGTPLPSEPQELGLVGLRPLWLP
jgi:hypothetical protein